MSSGDLDPGGELRRLAGDCVHCGFCLPACPTYQLWGEEMDSPRGRIHLMIQILDGAEGTEAAAGHLDRCLGCMACVPACPSGVRYDRLIEAAREWAEEPPAVSPAPAQTTPAQSTPAQSTPAQAGPAQPASAQPARALPARSRRDRAVRRAIFETFPYPDRLRLLMAPLRAAQAVGADRLLGRSEVVGRLAPELAAALRIAPPRPARAGRTPAGGSPGVGTEGRIAASGSPTGASRSRAGARRGLTGAVRGLAGSLPGRYGALPGRGRGRESVAASRTARLPERIAATGTRRAVVGMLTGCVQQVFFPEVNAATARVLAAEGCDVIVPRRQGCCGALSLHGGRRAEAADFARRTIETFEQAGVDAVVVNAAGCGSAMKEYGQLLADDPAWAGRAAALSQKVADLSEFLARLGAAAPRHPLGLTVVYQDACHLGHAQGITRQPRDLLRAIPELSLAEVGDGGTCCGSAGIYNLVQPEAAAQLGARKARTVQATGAELLVSANPGCAMQIAAALSDQGTPMPVAHIAQVLDASLRGLPPSSLLTR